MSSLLASGLDHLTLAETSDAQLDAEIAATYADIRANALVGDEASEYWADELHEYLAVLLTEREMRDLSVSA